jgi:hypothetical protein
MAKIAAVVQYILFCVFFAAGAGAIALSMLVEPEILDYYRNRALLSQIEADNEQIKSLTAKYDAQIREIRKDPNILSILEPITFGTEPVADDTAFPTASNEQLAAAEQVLLENLNRKPDEANIPQWVTRCAETKNRKVLFFAGSALILITFIFFGSPAKPQ